MREILFRGKKISDGEWIEGDLLRTTIDCVTYSFIFKDTYTYNKKTGDVTANNRSLVEPVTVGQYTGRIDKNGKRVFEGDIIRLCNGIPGFDVGVILWDDNDQAYLIVRDPVGRVMLDDFGNYGRPEYYEVIGNIHNNPELMGGAEDG